MTVLVDFHTHTTESDGHLSPEALTALFRTTGLDYVSVTDHDTLAAYERFPAAFAPLATRLIRGVEVSTHLDGRDVHMLAYNVPLGESPLREAIGDREALRRERAQRILDKLAQAGIALQTEDLAAQARGRMIGRAHIARAMVARGFARDTDDAFARYLGRAGAAYVPLTSLTPFAGIAAIRQSGAVAVLAHPSRGAAVELLPQLAQAGLQGLEVFYRTHEPHDIAYYKEAARAHGLVMTAGSDFHGPTPERPRPGMDVEPEDIEPFLRLIK